MIIYTLFISRNNQIELIGNYTDIFAAYKEVASREEMPLIDLNLSGLGAIYVKEDEIYFLKESPLVCREGHKSVELIQFDCRLIKTLLSKELQRNDDKIRLGESISTKGTKKLSERKIIDLMRQNDTIESLYRRLCLL
jgi:hypothetical protein